VGACVEGMGEKWDRKKLSKKKKEGEYNFIINSLKITKNYIFTNITFKKKNLTSN
jgi:hypothetical protein